MKRHTPTNNYLSRFPYIHTKKNKLMKTGVYIPFTQRKKKKMAMVVEKESTQQIG
jgi:hypothetical protein